jgi:hypothetical protein
VHVCSLDLLFGWLIALITSVVDVYIYIIVENFWNFFKLVIK